MAWPPGPRLTATVALIASLLLAASAGPYSTLTFRGTPRTSSLRYPVSQSASLMDGSTGPLRSQTSSTATSGASSVSGHADVLPALPQASPRLTLGQGWVVFGPALVAALAGLLFLRIRRRMSLVFGAQDGLESVAMAAYYSEKQLRKMDLDDGEYFVKARPPKYRKPGVLKTRYQPPPPKSIMSTEMGLDLELLMDAIGEEMGTDVSGEEGMAELMQAIWRNQHSRRWRKSRDVIGPPPIPVVSDGVLLWDGALALIVNIGGELQGSNKSVFLNNGRQFVWHASNKRSLETDHVQQMMQMGARRRFQVSTEGQEPRIVNLDADAQNSTGVPAKAVESELTDSVAGLEPGEGAAARTVPWGAPPTVLLFCRTSKRVPYVFCGELGDLVIDAETNPRSPTFLWTLRDHKILCRKEVFTHVVRKSMTGAYYMPTH